MAVFRVMSSTDFLSRSLKAITSVPHQYDNCYNGLSRLPVFSAIPDQMYQWQHQSKIAC